MKVVLFYLALKTMHAVNVFIYLFLWHNLLSLNTFSRLHAELRESVEKQLHALPTASGVEGSTLEEDAVIKNLQEQVQLSEQVCINVRLICLNICRLRHTFFFFFFLYKKHIVCGAFLACVYIHQPRVWSHTSIGLFCTLLFLNTRN